MKQIRTHFLEDGIGDLIMRTNNNAEMDVIEQIEDALNEVCEHICKHYANADMDCYGIKCGICNEDYHNKLVEVQKKLLAHCEECPLGRISHEFVSSNNT